MATIPLLVSANPEEVSCIWLHRGEKLVKGDLGLCDGSINQVLVELSQQVSTQGLNKTWQVSQHGTLPNVILIMALMYAV